MLYELHDPARYLTPDVTTNFTGVRLRQVEQDVVQVTGGSGSARPDTLKVTVSYRAGWIGEGQVSYGVPGASERARLAGQIVLDRLEPLGVRPIETRTEVVGVDSTFVPRDLIRPSVTVHEIRA